MEKTKVYTHKSIILINNTDSDRRLNKFLEYGWLVVSVTSMDTWCLVIIGKEVEK